MNKTAVFLETSLSVEEGKNILTEADFLGPAKKGSIIEAYHNGYNLIILIDGSFDWTPSVWHKEILYCLENGVGIVGGASMGALRAVELRNEGMHGIGVIYEMFEKNIIDGDDEVAVLNNQDTLAMVNIRYTVSNFPEEIKSEIISKTKNIFYKHRTWQEIKNHLNEIHFKLLKENYCDLKREDAIRVLEFSKKNAGVFQKKKIRTKTIYEKELFDEVILNKTDENKREFASPPLPLDLQQRARKVAVLLESPEDELQILEICNKLIEAEKLFYEFKEDYLISLIKEFREKKGLLKGDDFKAFLSQKNLLADDLTIIFSDYFKFQRLRHLNKN